MNFFNDEIHQDMVDMYRDFAQNSCGPIAAELDEQERFPEELIPVMAEMGLLGDIPQSNQMSLFDQGIM